MITRVLTTSGAAVLFAFMAIAGPAAALEAPEPGGGPTTTEPGPPNYPTYAPQYEVPQVAAQDTGIDASSAALGALAGIALGGAGLGVALAVGRHRHPQPA
jgi:hypothetical protein